MADKNGRTWSRIPRSSPYRYVAMVTCGPRIKWEMSYGGKSIYKDTEREAARMVDILRIKDGKDPVNILVRA